MLARLDHHPMLTALLALTTAALVVVVITLATLLIMAAPPTATSSSEGGANPAAPTLVQGSGQNYGEGWNNYGHDVALPQPAQVGNGADSAVDRPAEGISPRYDYYNNHYK